MILRYSPHFLRMLGKLSAGEQLLVRHTLTLFTASPYDPALRNHLLHGKHRGVRSLSAGHDLRILYVGLKGDVALLLTVGTHEEVY